MKSSLLTIAVFSPLLFSPMPVLAEQGGWTDRINFKGDFRLRYEGIDEEGDSNIDRARIRARFGLSAKVSEDLKIVVRLATGGGNPSSTNQTIGGGTTIEDIGFDQAYIDWRIAQGLNFYGGKMKNPFFRTGSSQLIWDSDLNPKGLALKVESGGVFGVAGGFVSGKRNDGEDSMFYIAQAGFTVALSEMTSATAGAGYFSFSKTIGYAAFYKGKAKGNTLDDNDFYVYGYKGTELFAQIDSELGGWALRLFAHYAKNNEVSGQNTAFSFGATLGEAKQKGQMQFAWAYQDLEADSLIGTFNNSDFGGGGTDADGYILQAKYAYSDKVFFGGTFFLNSVERFQGIEHDYSRIQLDVEFKFD